MGWTAVAGADAVAPSAGLLGGRRNVRTAQRMSECKKLPRHKSAVVAR